MSTMTRSEEVKAIDAWLATYKSSRDYVPRYQSRHTITKVENPFSDTELFDWVIDPAVDKEQEERLAQAPLHCAPLRHLPNGKRFAARIQKEKLKALKAKCPPVEFDKRFR